MKLLAALTAASCLLTTAASASDLSNTNSDKSQYNLFNPTPRDLMRPMNSDEYDNVFDAHTLDAGHFQIEGSLIDYYHYSAHYDFTGEAYRFEEYEYSWEPRFRVGLLNNVDFEVRPTYEIRSENYNGAYFSPYAPYAFDSTRRISDFERIALGPKINLWGNDEGPTALAIHPYLSVSPRSGPLLGGADIPFGVFMPWGLYLKLDTEIYLTDNSHRTDYVGFDNSISLHKTVCSKAEVYWYLDSVVTSDESQSWYGSSGFGVIYNLTPDLQFFGGIGFGLDSAAFDYNPRFGIVFRL